MSRMGVVVACLLMTGCGGADGPPKSEQYPVTGKVTLGGKPLSGYTISFVSTDSTENPAGFSGVTDESGAYTLTDQRDGSEGAFAGKYKVVLMQSPEAAMQAMTEGSKKSYGSGDAPFPKEYETADTSPKEVEVKPESNVINLDL